MTDVVVTVTEVKTDAATLLSRKVTVQLFVSQLADKSGTSAVHRNLEEFECCNVTESADVAYFHNPASLAVVSKDSVDPSEARYVPSLMFLSLTVPLLTNSTDHQNSSLASYESVKRIE